MGTGNAVGPDFTLASTSFAGFSVNSSATGGLTVVTSIILTHPTQPQFDQLNLWRIDGPWVASYTLVPMVQAGPTLQLGTTATVGHLGTTVSWARHSTVESPGSTCVGMTATVAAPPLDAAGHPLGTFTQQSFSHGVAAYLRQAFEVGWPGLGVPPAGQYVMPCQVVYEIPGAVFAWPSQ